MAMADAKLAEAEAVLSVERKATLLNGRDTWTTHPIDEVGIRPLKLADGPHGLRFQGEGGDAIGLGHSDPATCFPPAVALGSSWNPVIAELVGEAIGREARARQIDIVLGPGINIKRSPLCGRNFEYFSEDPLLTGMLGAAYVGGLQSTGVGASVKHFAVNNQETDRMRINAIVDERTLREIYLPAFERIVREAQPATVMSAYNKINGVFSSQNKWLLTEVLRNEWGFQGAVVSDWGAVRDPAAAVQAGLDLQMPSTNGRSALALMQAVESGELEENVIDRAFDRVRRLSCQGGAADNEIDFDAQHEVARRAAGECAVLLRNEGALPLNREQRIAVIGEFARTPRFQGGGSSHVNAIRIDSPLDSITTFAQEGVVFEPGFTLDGSSNEGLMESALNAARECDVAIVFAGLSELEESEGFDREYLDLPAPQIDVIRAVCRTAPQTVVVLSHGGVVSLEGWHDETDAILDGLLLGQGGGSAIADILYGAINPSGKLAETIPARLEDTPAFYNFPGEQGHVLYGERLMVGYRGHTTLGTKVRYPFGHGLSYTTFRARDFRVAVTGKDQVSVGLVVENVGDSDGAHVVQIYVDATALGTVHRPSRELRAFAKVHIPAGTSVNVELTLGRREFSYWDIQLGRWVVTPGSYHVLLGRDSNNIEDQVTIDLEGDHIIRELTLESTVEEWMSHPIVGDALLVELKHDMLTTLADPQMLRVLGSLPMQKIVNLLSGSLPDGAVESLMARTRQHMETLQSDEE